MDAAMIASSLPAPAPAITELFHRISRVLPPDQEILQLPPQMKAFEAISLLKVRNYSQAPVVENDTVVGIFSFRSFSVEVASQNPEKIQTARLLVEDCMEPVGPDQFRSVLGEFPPLIGLLDTQGAVLIGEPQRLQGIVTAIDLMRYLYGVASPFVLLTEIELGVRALIRHCVDDSLLISCAQNALKGAYKDRAIPARPEDMSFGDYTSIIGDGRNWSHFAEAFGGTRDRTRAKLEEIGRLRNDVFHFRRDLEPNDHSSLRLHRDWVLMRCRVVEARKGKEANDV
jgi:CBS domain-containing protein